MAKCYMYRQQHAGVVTTHVFLKPPTEEQLAPLRSETERLHGREGWGMLHEAELLGDEVPVFEKPRGVSTAMPGAVAQVVGTVSGS